MKCARCNIDQPENSFHKDKRAKSGRYGICKQCRKSDSKKYYWKNVKRIREYQRSVLSTPEGKKRNRQRVKEWRIKNKDTKSFKANRARRDLARRKKYPEKYKARYKLKHAVVAGKVKKKPCEKCGSKDVHGHHPDYSKPLEVTWLCHKHHLQVHNNNDFVSGNRHLAYKVVN